MSSDAKISSDDTSEEGTSSSSNTPSEQQSVGLSPLISLSSDFRAALDAFRHDWQREINAAANENTTPSTEYNSVCDRPTTLEDKHTLAMNLFRQAVELEQRGKVYDALPLYRRAVQIEPDIEFQYYKQQELKTANETRANEQVSAKNANAQDSQESEVIENLLDKFEADIDKNYNGRLILSNRDPGVISTSLHISNLPTELILYILQWVISNQLDVRSLENCAAVCKGLYLCARDEEIWRLACSKVWGLNLGTLEGPRIIPMSNENENNTPITKRYPSWRRMFIDRERVLYHGCYISKTTYLRMGENSFQDQFYRPVQLVEYYRYLRFLPDGTVLIMTTADEPQVGVTKLRNIFQVRGDVKKGEYFLNDNTITIIFNKTQQQAPNSRRQKRGNQTSEERNSTKYRLELKIASTNKRKFCKLVWENYSIVIVRNDVESVTEFDMTPAKYPSYWFSPVRSYHLNADSPLT